MAAITSQGFQVAALQMFHMEKANAEEFFEVYKGVVAEYIVSQLFKFVIFCMLKCLQFVKIKILVVLL
ncbi:Nucleoside diphosphate kinase 7 [Holothuria leucospilota]|uniref:Nucleoside diphosphate kinase 7 n=1 Tax=Holothuria leucospilota TaxID=206669 RepID=A0A9Q0YB34_HOLLE|nr:Nucleoside diphosphate kinase 7 [Holothuria leucospilota]